jgi:hypothetical protein
VSRPRIDPTRPSTKTWKKRVFRNSAVGELAPTAVLLEVLEHFLGPPKPEPSTMSSLRGWRDEVKDIGCVPCAFAGCISLPRRGHIVLEEMADQWDLSKQFDDALPPKSSKRPFHPYLTGRLVWRGWGNHSIGGDVNGARDNSTHTLSCTPWQPQQKVGWYRKSLVCRCVTISPSCAPREWRPCVNGKAVAKVGTLGRPAFAFHD